MANKGKQIALGTIAGVALVSGVTLAGSSFRGSASGFTNSGFTNAPVAYASTSKSSTVVKFPITVTDEAGNKVTISHRPVRIASVTEGTDEILSALVPIKDMVLVTTYGKQSAYSFVANKVKGIKGIASATAEGIIAARPDLVFLASYTTAGVVNQIRQAGIPVYELTDFNSIQQIEANIENVGRVVGREAKARAIVAAMKKRLKVIANDAMHKTKPKVMYYASPNYVAGHNTTMNSVILAAGGTNAASQVNGWQPETAEAVVKQNPQILLFSKSDEKIAEAMLHNPKYSTVAAVKDHRVFLLPDRDTGTVSQYIVDSVATVAKDIGTLKK